jgi:lipopolysaccharide export LptBFGC system permease protein LptF
MHVQRANARVCALKVGMLIFLLGSSLEPALSAESALNRILGVLSSTVLTVLAALYLFSRDRS